MAEYIEREALIAELGAARLYFLAHGEKESIWDIIERLPAVDAVEVVRCAECLFKQDPKQYGDLECKILGVPMKNDDFCSYGERKDGADG